MTHAIEETYAFIREMEDVPYREFFKQLTARLNLELNDMSFSKILENLVVLQEDYMSQGLELLSLENRVSELEIELEITDDALDSAVNKVKFPEEELADAEATIDELNCELDDYKHILS